MVKKASKRIYVLYQLKRSGIHQQDMARIYTTVIRPVLEYACPVWHSNLTKYLSDDIETVQRRAMRTIYPGTCYNEALELASLPTLQQRRETLCKEYFGKLKTDTHKLNKLLPEKREVSYPLRTTTEFPLPKVRTNRFKNSFIPWSLFYCQ